MSRKTDPPGNRTLWLLRHAKSSWSDGSNDDHDRPLEPRGQRAATLVGTYLRQRGARPALVLCSSARRALETLERVSAQLPESPEIVVEEGLYLASPSALLDRVRRIDEALESALLVGHNPGIGEFAHQLARRGDAGALERLAQRFPTGALAELRFDRMCWGELDFRTGTLSDFSTPKGLV